MSRNISRESLLVRCQKKEIRIALYTTTDAFSIFIHSFSLSLYLSLALVLMGKNEYALKTLVRVLLVFLLYADSHRELTQELDAAAAAAAAARSWMRFSNAIHLSRRCSVVCFILLTHR